MYSVLLVDDEQWILTDLKRLIDWESMGFRIAAEASSGTEAEMMIKAYRPDLIVSDIRMPGMDGLEMHGRISRKQKADSVTVFISAYDDFVYAREAIKLGAFDYILKPVKKSELTDTLRRVAERLGELRERNRREAEYERSRAFMEIVDNKTKPAEARRRLASFGLKLDNVSFRIAVVKAEEGMEEQELERVCGMLTSGKPDLSFLSVRLGSRKWACIINANKSGDGRGSLGNCDDSGGKSGSGGRSGDSGRGSEDVCDDSSGGRSDGCTGSICDGSMALRKHLRAFGRQLEERAVKVGISSRASDLGLLREAFREAELMADQGFITDRNGMHVYRRQAESGLDELMKRILTADAKQLSEAIAELRRRRSRLNLEGLMRLCNAILLRISQLYGKTEGLELFGEQEELYVSFPNAAAMLDALQDQLGEGAETPAGQTISHAIIREIAEEIEEHFDRKLMIASFAERYHLNMSYLSHLFKQETGESFTSRLVGVRMDKAAELLRVSELTLHEISERVGYDDYFHFSKLFKKHKNATPAAYRKQSNPSRRD